MIGERGLQVVAQRRPDPKHWRHHSSPARVELSSPSMMSRMSNTISMNSGLSLHHRAPLKSGGGIGMSLRIVPGADGHDQRPVAEVHGLLNRVRNKKDGRLRSRARDQRAGPAC